VPNRCGQYLRYEKRGLAACMSGSLKHLGAKRKRLRTAVMAGLVSVLHAARLGSMRDGSIYIATIGSTSRSRRPPAPARSRGTRCACRESSPAFIHRRRWLRDQARSRLHLQHDCRRLNRNHASSVCFDA
jgi:hypothetical protein